MRATAALALVLSFAPLSARAAASPEVSAGPAAAAALPSAVVETAAQKLLDDLSAHRQEYRRNPTRLRAAVDRDILPFIDIKRSARLVLGRFWRTATADQRRRFVDAFESRMLRNYGNALIDFRSDRMQVFPSHVSEGDNVVIVRTRIRRDNGSDVSVNYAMGSTPSGWKAWDVIIEGISYVKSFRDDIGTEIEQQGLEATIRRWQNG